MSTANGVTIDDFNQIYADMKRPVTYYVSTKTTDFAGNEINTFATGTVVDMIFFLEQNRFLFDKEGLLEVGDAYVIAPLSMNIKRYDKITVNGIEYYIDNVTRRRVLDVDMMDYATLFLTSDNGQP